MERTRHVESRRVGKGDPGRVDQEDVGAEYVGPDESPNRRRPAGYPADHVVDRTRAREGCALRAAEIELQEAVKEVGTAQFAVDLVDDEVIGVTAERNVLTQGAVAHDLCRGSSGQAK